MRDIQLLHVALGVVPPWQVKSCKLDLEQQCLDIEVDFDRGSTFHCPQCDRTECKAHDTERRTWRHLNFFQYKTLLHARVPRVRCDDCGILTVKVPWARPGSGFTLLFEALAMMMMKAMPVRVTARIVGEHDTRLWRVLAHYVLQARVKLDLSSLQAVGLDETASRRGHNYVSLFADLDQHQVIFATEGKDAGTIEAFKADLILHGGDPKAVEEFCCDMSPAYISGITEHFPHAELTFDKYHVLKIINEAVDEVRRQEQRERPELSGSRYAWLTNPENQTRAQAARIHELLVSQRNLKTARAYHIRLNFQDFWEQTSEQAEVFLKGWYFWATHSRLQPIIEAAATIKRHWNGVLRWFKSRISNGVLEGINSLVQAAKARARGYRTTRNLIMMVYLIAGKLEFNLPHPY
jgi:transposase